MGISCKFQNYKRTYEILGCIRLYYFLAFEDESRLNFREKLPSRSMICRFKKLGLDMIMTSKSREFLSNSFDVLVDAMNHHKIGFILYYNSDVILTNVSSNLECMVKLVTKNKESIYDLIICATKFDLYDIPFGVKVNGKDENDKD